MEERERDREIRKIREREREKNREGERRRGFDQGRVMDGRDGWHVASFQASSHKTIINPVMLRFRPIAPKPVSGGSYPGGNPAENMSSVLRTTKRVKRKYVRVRRDNKDKNPRRRDTNNSYNINGSCGEEGGDGLNSTTTTVTLQLMPEKSDGLDLTRSTGGTGSWRIINQYCTAVQDNNNCYKNCNATTDEVLDLSGVVVRSGPAAAEAVGEVVESWVTVEGVTDTCMDVRGLGSTDVERIKNLERDTCPGFVSDGCFSKVEWVNDAFKKMVAEEEEVEWWPEVVVWLVTNNNNDNMKNKNNNPSRAELGLMGPAFTCRVRVQYKRVNTKEKCSKIMPCDVWRMDCGGFAWRLDVKAALSLGLGF
ncbi:uncharacterized protein LOC133817125 [Humulus lupulus]|uniref:uncharacterized protein LOC133817125 n=1 Tax=Humulus lupulus TaxID=3486 RepID=UPI002B41267C|nr:uncharacterized protein LOC133817125 [Humulus lupulus]